MCKKFKSYTKTPALMNLTQLNSLEQKTQKYSGDSSLEHMQVAQHLFVHREVAFLDSVKGETCAYQDLPKILASPMQIGYWERNVKSDKLMEVYIRADWNLRGFPLNIIKRLKNKAIIEETSNLAKAWSKTQQQIFSYPFDSEQHSSIHYGNLGYASIGLWSGTRSTLVLADGDLYRLKGCAFDSEVKWKIPWGGQYLWNARFEHKMSEQFASILTQNGIEPVMEYAGMYHLPFKHKGRKLATSIIKVKGDTRLDEFMYALEMKIPRRTMNKLLISKNLKEKLKGFYYICGDISGQLIKLMHHNGMSWSDNSKRMNSHLGNVVLYHHDENNLGIGMVDFDAACSQKEYHTQKKFEKQILAEIQRFDESLTQISSMRPIGKFFSETTIPLMHLRTAVAQGFQNGYNRKKLFPTRNLIQKAMLDDIVMQLKKETAD